MAERNHLSSLDFVEMTMNDNVNLTGSPGRAFRDRHHAGQILARSLIQYAGRSDVIIYALPRGGVPVAFEVAKLLKAPLDLVIVRKIGTPGNAEVAMGAIAPEGVSVINRSIMAEAGISEDEFLACERLERKEQRRRETLYRGEAPYADLSGKTAILIDDGLATGATMRAAIFWVKAKGAHEIVVAVPIAARESCAALEEEGLCHRCIAILTPEPFQAVGLWYLDFDQVTDEEVMALLQELQGRTHSLNSP
jgi:putative phosphoribosyl transferase